MTIGIRYHNFFDSGISDVITYNFMFMTVELQV